MSMLVLLMAAAAAGAASAAVPAADPLAPARQGKVQCYQPDTAARTCASFGGYRFLPDGAIVNDAEVMLAPSPLISIRTADPVTVRDGKVCGYLGRIEDMRVLVAGAPADEKTAALVQAELRKGMARFAGKEICSTYSWTGSWFESAATVAGVPDEGMARRVIWVLPSDGYRLGGP